VRGRRTEPEQANRRDESVFFVRDRDEVSPAPMVLVNAVTLRVSTAQVHARSGKGAHKSISDEIASSAMDPCASVIAPTDVSDARAQS
jgi:hypothetical protein